MASIVKRLRPRIVVPICVGSNPTTRPIKKQMASLLSAFLLEYCEDEYTFSGQMIFRLNRLFLPQSAVCKGFGGRKFPTNNHFRSPESPKFLPTSLKYSLTCPNSVHERILGLFRLFPNIFHLK